MPANHHAPSNAQARPLTRRAYAKINLCLSVGAAQPQGTLCGDKDVSGYHHIASWMACINLYDDVTISRKPEGEPSTCDRTWASDAPRPTPLNWPLSDDLAWRAHAAMEKEHGQPLPVCIQIAKRIPVGGGLGGGSSDAACVLVMLNKVFELGMTDEALRGVALSLGSDVAFFVDEEDKESDESEGDESEDDGNENSPESFDRATTASRPALVSSFGEAVVRVDPVETELVLVVPPFSCETRAVYRVFDELLAVRVASKKTTIAVHKGEAAAERYEAQDARDDLVLRRIEKATRAGVLDGDSLFNDLFLPAVQVEPRVGRLVTALSKATRTQAHLTGSGSCIFLVPEPTRADWLLAKVRKTLDSLPGHADETESGDRPAGSVAILLKTV